MRLAVKLAGVPLGLLLAMVFVAGATTGSQASGCGATAAAGPGPTAVTGVPVQYLPYYEAAAEYFRLGTDGWAYLAALNDAESTYGTNNGPGTGVLSGSNSAGAAGPMQIGIGGAATDNWATIVGLIPANLAGGAQPPSVYNEQDAVYGAAALLSQWGAPGDWQAALTHWNDFPPEITQVTQLVAQYTNTAQGTQGTQAPAAGQCAAAAGASTPGAAPAIAANGLAEIPQAAPAAVQEMIAAGNEITSYPYSYGGGHCVAAMTDPPGPSSCPGDEENGAAGYDCSSSASFVLWGGGRGHSVLDGTVGDSTTLQSVGDPGPGQWVTIYAGESDGQGHAFIEVAGVVLDTVHGTASTPAGSGPRWQPASEIAYELAHGSFVARHPPGL